MLLTIKEEINETIVPSSMIDVYRQGCDDLCVSRQTVITAWEHLVKRNRITFTEGKSRIYRQPKLYLAIYNL